MIHCRLCESKVDTATAFTVSHTTSTFAELKQRYTCLGGYYLLAHLHSPLRMRQQNLSGGNITSPCSPLNLNNGNGTAFRATANGSIDSSGGGVGRGGGRVVCVGGSGVRCVRRAVVS